MRRLAPDVSLERCDDCNRFADDCAALDYVVSRILHDAMCPEALCKKMPCEQCLQLLFALWSEKDREKMLHDKTLTCTPNFDKAHETLFVLLSKEEQAQ